MTTYRAGQRVRIEWPDDDAAMEGRLIARSFTGLVREQLSLAMPDAYYALENLPGDCTVTVMSEPRPDEPTGLGAVVEASAADVAVGARLTWVRARTERNEWRPSTEVYCDNSGFYRAWASLIDPVVLSEGWTP